MGGAMMVGMPQTVTLHHADGRAVVCFRGNARVLAEQAALGFHSEVEQETQDEVETCDVVKADGEVCGRELPCSIAAHRKD